MMTPYLFRLATRIQTGLQQLPEEFRERQRQFFLSRQLPEGGFSGRDVDLNGQPLFEDGSQPDLYYTSFAIRGLTALSGLDEATGRKISGWLQQAAGRATSAIDIVNWLYSSLMVQAACGIDCLADAPENWPENVAALLESLRQPDGGYAKKPAGGASSTYHSFLIALCYELMGREVPNRSGLIEFVRQRQRDDGGFVEVAAMKHSGTNPTAAAIALLSMSDALEPAICEAAAAFLTEVRGDDGGFQANTRIPFSDVLSTFTGYLTSLDISEPGLLPRPALQRFLSELELPTGGFLAAGWDRVADVEYSFYALGTLGLLHGQIATSG